MSKVLKSLRSHWVCAGFIAAMTVAVVVAPVQVLADDAGDAKAIVDQSETTLKNFLSDPDM